MNENSSITPEQVLQELEGSAFWSVKYLNPNGFLCQLSLEASTGIEVLKRAQSALEHLKGMQCVPIQKVAELKENESSSKSDTSFCSIHHTQMKLWHKDGRSWYAHKSPDSGWCRGKQP